MPKDEYVPTEHFPLPLDEIHPSKQYLPAGHGKHAFSENEPFLALYVPGGQRTHARDDELSAANDPSSQCILIIPEWTGADATEFDV